MCGIVGYVGPRKATPILVDGLRRLEYRGYDSAGVALYGDEHLWVRRAVGRIDQLAEAVVGAPSSQMGIAHTRWATHGGITEENAHPHTDAAGRIAVVHNGIIENNSSLRAQLEAEGVVFLSETDTEILPHLIRKHYRGNPLEAVERALRQVRGTYGIAVLFADHPGTLIAARHGSPLVLGIGDQESFIASDPQALVAHTRRVVYLDDREIALVSAGSVQVGRLGGSLEDPNIKLIDDDWGLAELDGFPHFMLKEIHEQGESILRALRGRVQVEEGNAKLGGLNMEPRDLVRVERVVSLGCGTSFHAGLAASLAIEHLARVPADSEIASEFRHRNPIIPKDALYMAISQSGETADTLGAIQEVRLKGGVVMGVVNAVGSTIARTCGAGVYVHSGPEIAVASTKAFTSQLTAMLVFTLMLARTRNLSLDGGRRVAAELQAIPDKVVRYLKNPGPIDEMVRAVTAARYVLFLGRGFSYPVALEGALKLKEVAYIPCEAYPAGEMKHGPIAMLEENTPVIFITSKDDQRDKAISNMREVLARGAKLIVIHPEGDEEVKALAHISIEVPAVADYLSPLLNVIPLQLLAYRAGLVLGRDIDKPRHLAKSVTVE
ncbi:MAG: glutamine--fructose-6-phosphate transaminase (isomerizing) [Deltaproteobacteria bacterium]|nr:glutamine--fructose-6-phosphate transaminase (isomerizing) [Deltaproteobacteria bacterium]